MKTFFMVVRESTNGYYNTPTKMHDSRPSAHEEAERLCRKHCSKFYVVECNPTGVCEPQDFPIVWKKI